MGREESEYYESTHTFISTRLFATEEIDFYILLLQKYIHVFLNISI